MGSNLVARGTLVFVTLLGPFADEPPEPMTRDDFMRIQKRLRDSGWSGSVTIENRDVQRMLHEIRWLKQRLHRVEFAVQPLVDELKR